MIYNYCTSIEKMTKTWILRKGQKKEAIYSPKREKMGKVEKV